MNNLNNIWKRQPRSSSFFFAPFPIVWKNKAADKFNGRELRDKKLADGKEWPLHFKSSFFVAMHKHSLKMTADVERTKHIKADTFLIIRRCQAHYAMRHLADSWAFLFLSGTVPLQKQTAEHLGDYYLMSSLSFLLLFLHLWIMGNHSRGQQFLALWHIRPPPPPPLALACLPAVPTVTSQGPNDRIIGTRQGCQLTLGIICLVPSIKLAP